MDKADKTKPAQGEINGVNASIENGIIHNLLSTPEPSVRVDALVPFICAKITN